MMRLYLDSAPIISHVERTVPFAVAVDARLTAPGIVLVSSELTRLECFVLPPRNGDTAREGEFDMFFNARMDVMVDFTGAVFCRAAEIRASHGFKTPDALHLAAVVVGGCAAFLTNDAQLARFPRLAVEVLELGETLFDDVLDAAVTRSPADEAEPFPRGRAADRAR